MNLQIVCELVAMRPGVQLRTAADGHAGIAMARELVPDAVLLDMQLPDMHGLEVLRALRSHPSTAQCRCIALSADAMPEHLQRALDAGFDAYWTKPIDFGKFLAGLDALLAELPGSGPAELAADGSVFAPVPC